MKLQLQLKCDLDGTDSIYLNHLHIDNTDNFLTLQIAPDGETRTTKIALQSDKVDQLIEFLKKVREKL